MNDNFPEGDRYRQLNIAGEIRFAQQNPNIKSVKLSGNRNSLDPLDHDRHSIREQPTVPLETLSSPSSDTKQELMAMIALGGNVALGVVRGSSAQGDVLHYISLFTDSPNKERSGMIGVLIPGEKLTIGRDDLQHDFPERTTDFKGVSSRHCTISIDEYGLLTVVDENSTNGTTVLTNASENEGIYKSHDVRMWSRPTSEIDRYITVRRNMKDVGMIASQDISVPDSFAGILEDGALQDGMTDELTPDADRTSNTSAMQETLPQEPKKSDAEKSHHSLDAEQRVEAQRKQDNEYILNAISDVPQARINVAVKEVLGAIQRSAIPGAEKIIDSNASYARYLDIVTKSLKSSGVDVIVDSGAARRIAQSVERLSGHDRISRAIWESIPNSSMLGRISANAEVILKNVILEIIKADLQKD